MRLRSLLVLPCLCSLAVAACGGDDGTNAKRFKGDEKDVAAVIDDLTSAARDGDGDKICDELLTENLRISIQRSSGRSCAKEVRANVFKKTATFGIKTLKVKGSLASAAVVDETGQRSQLIFEKAGDDWRIARIG